ncbi:beta-eliminating lyase [Pelomyxa schiedti]|nr:beta-eliminating lyase [Pelomyxa schiedti]
MSGSGDLTTTAATVATEAVPAERDGDSTEVVRGFPPLPKRAVSPPHTVPSMLTPPTQFTYVVRRSRWFSALEREDTQRKTEYNCFAFPASMLVVDYLSDSGTSAMTDFQWSALVRGDGAYAGNYGYTALKQSVRDIFEGGDNPQPVINNMICDPSRSSLVVPVIPDNTFANEGKYALEHPNLFLVPQGRCAENLFFSVVRQLWKQDARPLPYIIPSNGFFDTTEAQAHTNSFRPVNLFAKHLHTPFPVEECSTRNPFKGNIDTEELAALITREGADHVPAVLLTVTNNTAAGQPVSMQNIRETARIAHSFNIPVVFDAARFAENAFLIREFEEGYSSKSIQEIVKEMFSYCDCFLMSAKKDALCNIGGLMCFRNKGLFHKQFSKPDRDVGLVLKEKQILTYGNPCTGGLSGRDIMAMAEGLYQVVKLNYLRRRVLQVRYLAEGLVAAGVQGVVLPPGGHAVYLDMTEFFEGTPMKIDDFGGVGFVIEMIRLYGIRVCELGPFAFEWDQKTPVQRQGILNLVRFAVPRNMYNDDHLKYTIAASAQLYKHREKIPKVTVSRGAELHLRHFQSGLTPNYYNGKLGEE